MPSPGRVQLNLSLEPDIKESLKRHCDNAGLSFAQAITEFVKACDKHGELIVSPMTNPSPDIDLDNYVTRDELEKKLSNSASIGSIPSLDQCIDIDEKVNLAVNRLREELVPIINAEKELQELLEKQEA